MLFQDTADKEERAQLKNINQRYFRLFKTTGDCTVPSLAPTLEKKYRVSSGQTTEFAL